MAFPWEVLALLAELPVGAFDGAGEADPEVGGVAAAAAFGAAVVADGSALAGAGEADSEAGGAVAAAAFAGAAVAAGSVLAEEGGADPEAGGVVAAADVPPRLLT